MDPQPHCIGTSITSESARLTLQLCVTNFASKIHVACRHGTCSCLTELEYLNATLVEDAFDQYSERDLVPFGAPPKVDIVEVPFKRAYGHDLQVTHRKHDLAFQVQFCLDKSWGLIECPLETDEMLVDSFSSF